MADNNDQSNEQPEVVEKGHSGQAKKDMDAMANFEDESKEIKSSVQLNEAIGLLSGPKAKTAEQLEREKALASVVIKKTDVELLMKELEVSKQHAEKTLREHMGNVQEALSALINE